MHISIILALELGPHGSKLGPPATKKEVVVINFKVGIRFESDACTCCHFNYEVEIALL